MNLTGDGIEYWKAKTLQKDAEIEYLKSTNKRQEEYACALQCEIERLSGQIDVRDAVISKLSGTVARWRPLITHAADELKRYAVVTETNLIHELREAVK